MLTTCQQNAKFVEVLYDGWPYVFLVSLSTLKAGTEVHTSAGGGGGVGWGGWGGGVGGRQPSLERRLLLLPLCLLLALAGTETPTHTHTHPQTHNHTHTQTRSHMRTDSA